MTLAQFVDTTAESDLSLVVVNRESPEPLQRLLEELFETQPVTVREQQLPAEGTDCVFLVDDDRVVATSSLAALEDAILLVNSDLYVTGTRDVEAVEVPDVISGLEDVPFRLQGYPESKKEKFLLIVISRYIEQVALEHGGGTHRASFQKLSRIDGEQGTRAVYETLGDSAVDTHVYGVPDWTPPRGFGVTMHGGWTDEFRNSWFVTFVPPDEDDRHAALVAIETDANVWKGFWTYDTERVRTIARYIRHEL